MSKTTKYTVKAHFEVWVSTTVRATSIEQATTIGRAMGISDYFDIPEDTEVIDATTLDGFGVEEPF